MNKRWMILAGIIFLSFVCSINFVKAVDVSACQTLSQSNTVYTMTRNLEDGDVNSTGCFNITATNVTLNCNGFYIKNTTISSAGIYSNKINTVVKNCDITTKLTSAGKGIYFEGANNSYIINNTIRRTYLSLSLIKSTNVTVTNNTLISSGYAGLYILTNSNFSIVTNNVFFNSTLGYGIFLDVYNTLIENNSFINNSYAISSSGVLNYTNITGNTFYSRSGRTINAITSGDNIIANNIFYYGQNSFYSSYSNRDIFYNNSFYHSYKAIEITEAVNTSINNNNFFSNSYGIFISSAVSSDVKNNIFTKNEFAFSKSLSSINYTANILNDNLISLMINSSNLDSVRREYSSGENISFNVTINALGNASVDYLNYSISVYPDVSYSLSNLSNNLSIKLYDISKTGVYTIKINASFDNTGNRDIRSFVFFFGNTSNYFTRYYFHQDEPRNGQVLALSGSDSGSLLLEPSTTHETRTCGVWVQFMPDNVNSIYPSILKNASLNFFYTSESSAFIKFQKYATYSTDGDFNSDLSASSSGYNSTTLTNLNVTLDYNWRFYFVSTKFQGSNILISSNSTNQSYADFTHSYAGPKIIQFSEESGSDIKNAQILSSVFGDNTNKNVSIQLDGVGNFTMTLNLTSDDYIVNYDGINCSLNSNCTLNQNSDGIVNVTITLGSLHTLNVYADSYSPSVSLISPSNALSTTSTSFNFIYNVSDSSVSNCSLILDGNITNFNSSVNISGGNNTFTNSSSVGSHTWSVNCTDIYGNTGNSSQYSLTITSSSASNSTSSSSGGGINTYNYEQKELTDPSSQDIINQDISLSEKIKIIVNEEKHSITLSRINSTSATFTIASSPQIVNLLVGETKEILIENVFVIITLNEIKKVSGIYKANLTIKPKTEEPTKNNPQENINENKKEIRESPSTHIIKYILIILSISFILLAIYLRKIMIKKKKY